jgi:hypothetical protein
MDVGGLAGVIAKSSSFFKAALKASSGKETQGFGMCIRLRCP